MPFECDICKKKFPAQSDLTAHKKWHNGKTIIDKFRK